MNILYSSLAGILTFFCICIWLFFGYLFSGNMGEAREANNADPVDEHAQYSFQGDNSSSINDTNWRTSEEEKFTEEPEGVNTLSNEEKKAVTDFVKDYITEGIIAIKLNDFDYIEPYLDPNGKAYQQSKESIQKANETGVFQDLIDFDGKEVIRINDYAYRVTTYEEYEITAADGSRKINGYNSDYIIIQMPNNTLALNQTANVKKIFSERSQ